MSLAGFCSPYEDNMWGSAQSEGSERDLSLTPVKKTPTRWQEALSTIRFAVLKSRWRRTIGRNWSGREWSTSIIATFNRIEIVRLIWIPIICVTVIFTAFNGETDSSSISPLFCGYSLRFLFFNHIYTLFAKRGSIFNATSSFYWFSNTCS